MNLCEYFLLFFSLFLKYYHTHITQCPPPPPSPSHRNRLLLREKEERRKRKTKRRGWCERRCERRARCVCSFFLLVVVFEEFSSFFFPRCVYVLNSLSLLLSLRSGGAFERSHEQLETLLNAESRPFTWYQCRNLWSRKLLRIRANSKLSCFSEALRDFEASVLVDFQSRCWIESRRRRWLEHVDNVRE